MIIRKILAGLAVYWLAGNHSCFGIKLFKLKGHLNIATAHLAVVYKGLHKIKTVITLQSTGNQDHSQVLP